MPVDEMLTESEMADIAQMLYDWDIERFLNDEYNVECDGDKCGCRWMREQGLVTESGVTTPKGIKVRDFIRRPRKEAL